MRRSYKLAITLTAIAILAGLLIKRCSPEEKELQRSTSPDRVVDAVLVARLVNATVATPYLVYIVPAGSNRLSHPVLVGDDFVGFKLMWKAPRFLVIQFTKGEIFSFTNLWMSKKVKNFRYLVEIRLQPLEDRSVPSWDQPTR